MNIIYINEIIRSFKKIMAIKTINNFILDIDPYYGGKIIMSKL